MKKIYTLAIALFGTFAFGQTPILTTIVDGPCTGGTPKLLEIYASGTVDFTQYTLQNQTNANTTWGTGTNGSQDLSSFGTRTNEFVYVVMTNGDLSIATTEFPSVTEANSIESGTMNLNGDDRVRIILTGTETVIDQFGVSDIDGTDTSWEWLDSYAKRVNGTGPDAGFVEANWVFGGVDALDNEGICKEADALQNTVQLGSYTANASIKDNNIAGLSIYPNPATGSVLNVTSHNNIEKSVAIFDVLGKQVINTKTVNGSVNIADLNAGVYIVKVTEEGKTATRKLVVK